MTDLLSGAFHQPFEEQIKALELRMRNKVGTAKWDDLQKAQHEYAFVVAGVTKAEILDDFEKAILKAGRGSGFDEFKKDFRKIVETRGWHGWTGEGTAKGEDWRMRVIYRTNMATSYAAGRMAQLVDGGFSIWVYKHGNAKEPRLQHLAWDGVALPPDHPFWQTHAPPNGWGCTCRIRGANTTAGVKRAGGDPNKLLPEGWEAVDPKSGAPVGIDKGWDYAVGASSANDNLAMRGKDIGKAEANAASDAVRLISAKLPVLSARVGAELGRILPPSAQEVRLTEFSTFVDEALSGHARGSTKVVGSLQPNWVAAAAKEGIVPETAEIAVRDKDIQHTFRDAKADQLDLAWYRQLPENLQKPDAVILDQTHADPAFLLIYQGANSTSKLVIRVNYKVKKVGVMNIVETGQTVDATGIRGMIGQGYTLVEGSL